MHSGSTHLFAMAATLALVSVEAAAQPRTLEAALGDGAVSGSFNLRYEGVDEDNALENAEAVTLRTALKYTTAALNGFTGVLEVEDVRILGVGDFSVPQSGYNAGRYSVIADPETTELNQGYLQYVDGGFSARIGRQDIRYDNQRFIGAVPWRQDYQSFDAVSLQFKKDTAQAYTLNYHYLAQRERVFAQDADIDSKDHVLHGVIATPIGNLAGYAYLLEDDIALSNSLDTYGVRLTGTRKLAGVDATYLVEYATQDSQRGSMEFNADYYVVEGGATVKRLTAKLGYESLGSDNAAYGFATPLATAHAFQGWADQFVATPNEGIDDVYLSLATPVGGGTLTFVYHDYSAAESSATVDDLGEEFNLQWLRPIRNNFQYGIKFADYHQGDMVTKVDKQVFWTWLQMTF